MDVRCICCFIIIYVIDLVSSSTCKNPETLNVEYAYKPLESPNHPEPYDHNLRCEFILEAPPGQQIELLFTFVNTEEGFDKIKIYDGAFKTGALLSVLEGTSHSEQRFISSMGTLTVSFNSDTDHSLQYKGFSAKYRIVLLPKVRVVSDIRACLAENYVRSEMTNDDKSPRNVTFSILYPRNSFASGLSIQIGNTVFTGEIKRRSKIARTYNSTEVSQISISKGGSSRDVFNELSTSVLLQPNETVVFEFSYVELLTRRLGRYTDILSLPRELLIGDVDYEVNICGRAPLTFVQVPDMKLTENLSYIEQKEILGEMDYFDDNVVVDREGEIARIRYSQRSEGRLEPIGLDGDLFVVHYDVERGENGVVAAVDGDYFGHFYAPKLPVLRRRIVFLLDVSGSMAGTKIEQVKIAMNNVLERLTETDYFNIVELETTVRSWRKFGLHEATPENIESAQEYIQALKPDGGTNIEAGLVQALSLLQQGVQFESILRKIDVNPFRDFIFFLGDGKPTAGEKDPEAILDTISQVNRRGYGINAIGFGTDVDSVFLGALTSENSGKWKLILDTNRAHVDIQNFLVDLGVPVMTKVKFTYMPYQVKDTTLLEHPVLIDDGEVVVFGRYSPKVRNESINMYIRGRTHKNFIDRLKLPVPAENKSMCVDIGTGSYAEKGYALTIVQNNLIEMGQNPTPERRQELKNEIVFLAIKIIQTEYLQRSIVVIPAIITANHSLVLKRGQDSFAALYNGYGFLTPLTSLVLPKPGFITKQDDAENLVAPVEAPRMIIQGDPHFAVNLSKNITLCFTWTGVDNRTYNILRDPNLEFNVNGLIKESPMGLKIDGSKKNKNISRTYFVSMGFLFQKDGLYIKLTTNMVSIIPLNQDSKKYTYHTTQDRNLKFGKVSIQVFNATIKRSLIKISYKKNITFIVRQVRAEEGNTKSPEEEKPVYKINHLDLDVFDEGYLLNKHSRFMGLFANILRQKRASIFTNIAYVESRKFNNILHYRNIQIPVTLQSIHDPNKQKSIPCWHTQNPHKILGGTEKHFRVPTLRHVPNYHKRKQEIT